MRWTKVEGKHPLLPKNGQVVVVKLRCGKFAMAEYFCDDTDYGFKPCGVSKGSKFAGTVKAWKEFLY